MERTIFVWACRMEYELSKIKSDFFYSFLRIKVMPPRVFPISLYRESMCLQSFLPTRYVNLLALWLYYACNYTVAVSLGLVNPRCMHRRVTVLSLCLCVCFLLR